MTHNVTLRNGRTATLSTDHATSSHGQPVLIVDGVALGPGDAILRGAWVQPGDTAPIVIVWHNLVVQSIMTLGLNEATCPGCGLVYQPRTPTMVCSRCGSRKMLSLRTGAEPGPKPRH